MGKIFIIAFLIFGLLTGGAAAQDRQKTRKISEMIGDSQKVSGLLSGLLGGALGDSEDAEITNLSAVTFPNAVKVKYLNETRKIGKTRKKAVDKWLREYNKTPDAKKFYLNETAVEEDGTRYWIMAHQAAVIDKLKNAAKKDDQITLNVRILGFYKKGQTTDYFLLAESVDGF